MKNQPRIPLPERKRRAAIEQTIKQLTRNQKLAERHFKVLTRGEAYVSSHYHWCYNAFVDDIRRLQDEIDRWKKELGS